ncbi:uncharacterized protein LOC107264473 [Cephus cinctus]|uniref:Uncharacterized protein LOC107264473 n=1 Tax=Cephus cinctus TaxID=211228 RepID=A0AAJ7FES9_CEPCN|nr:uncharacterized protein LOC107264473 [Cephus cinctus]
MSDNGQQLFFASMEQKDDIEERLRILLKEGAKTPADMELRNLELPSYYDPRKFALGQKAFRDNVFTMMIAKLAGLLILLAVPSILNVLKYTKQSGTPCTAFRRYVSTILHTFIWYEKSPDKDSRFFESLRNVRRKHCVASRRAARAGLERISQLDMALTQFGFIGFTLLNGDQLGVVTSSDELEGLVHVWRVVGSMLGMEERFNLCRGSLEETRGLCRRLLDEIFVPHLSLANEDFPEMGRVLLEGLWPVNPHLDPRAFSAFTLRLVTSATTNNNHSLVIDNTTLSLYSRFILGLQLFVHDNLLPRRCWWSIIFRTFFNGQMRLAIYLTENCPFLAYWSFGREESRVNIFKCHLE